MNAPYSPTGFIAELCLALAHRWEPERIFVALTLTAYFDESGTHNDSPVTIMGAVLANAQQWERFERAFAKLKKKHGFRVLHTKKFKRRDGDFKGWSNDQQVALMSELGKLTEGAFTESIAVSLDNAKYDADYRGGDKPRRHIESRYGLCFTSCLTYFISAGLKRVYKRRPPRIHFVLEAGHRNWNEVRQIFADEKKYLQSHNCDMLGDITFAKKEECDPLMMADFLSHFAYMQDTAPKGENQKPARPLGHPFPFVEEGKGAFTHLSFDPGALAEFKVAMTERLVARKKRYASLSRSTLGV